MKSAKKETQEQKEFEERQAQILSSIPEEFHGYFSHIAWEEGHSSGYSEVLNCLILLLDGFESALEKYTARVKRELFSRM